MSRLCVQEFAILCILRMTRLCHMTEVVHFSTLAMATGWQILDQSVFPRENRTLIIPSFLRPVNTPSSSGLASDGRAWWKRHGVTRGPVPADTCGGDVGFPGRPWPGPGTRETGRDAHWGGKRLGMDGAPRGTVKMFSPPWPRTNRAEVIGLGCPRYRPPDGCPVCGLPWWSIFQQEVI